MTRDEFWKTIEENVDVGEDGSVGVNRLTSALEKMSSEALILFQGHFDELHAHSYLNSLWGAAYLIRGGCSDDGFDYFRSWLIARGRCVFDAAIRDPDSLRDALGSEEIDGWEVECEDLLSLARGVHESRFGEMPDCDRSQWSDRGADWDFDDDEEMKGRYPRIFAWAESFIS